jgi:hypothetical protein
MPYFGLMYGNGRDGTVRQINSVREIDLAAPRWQRFNLTGNWSVKSPPLAMIEVYENVDAQGNRVVALFTECEGFDEANARFLDFLVAAGVWFAGATNNDTTSSPSPVPATDTPAGSSAGLT